MSGPRKILGATLWEREVEILRSIENHARTAVKASTYRVEPESDLFGPTFCRKVVQVQGKVTGPNTTGLAPPRYQPSRRLPQARGLSFRLDSRPQIVELDCVKERDHINDLPITHRHVPRIGISARLAVVGNRFSVE